MMIINLAYVANIHAPMTTKNFNNDIVLPSNTTYLNTSKLSYQEPMQDNDHKCNEITEAINKCVKKYKYKISNKFKGNASCNKYKYSCPDEINFLSKKHVNELKNKIPQIFEKEYKDFKKKCDIYKATKKYYFDDYKRIFVDITCSGIVETKNDTDELPKNCNGVYLIQDLAEDLVHAKKYDHETNLTYINIEENNKILSYIFINYKTCNTTDNNMFYSILKKDGGITFFLEFFNTQNFRNEISKCKSCNALNKFDGFFISNCNSFVLYDKSSDDLYWIMYVIYSIQALLAKVEAIENKTKSTTNINMCNVEKCFHSYFENLFEFTEILLSNNEDKFLEEEIIFTDLNDFLVENFEFLRSYILKKTKNKHLVIQSFFNKLQQFFIDNLKIFYENSAKKCREGTEGTNCKDDKVLQYDIKKYLTNVKNIFAVDLFFGFFINDGKNNDYVIDNDVLQIIIKSRERIHNLFQMFNVELQGEH